MKISFSVDGGFAVFPGLAKPVTIDVDKLPAAIAQRVHSLVGESRFFERAQPALAPGAADMRKYVVALDDGIRSRTLTIPEDVTDPDLKALVQMLEAHRRDATKR